ATSGELHRSLQLARQAQVVDLIGRWQQATQQPAIVVSDDVDFLSQAKGIGASAQRTAGEFSFLSVLKEVLQSDVIPQFDRDSACIVVGGGALPLASLVELEQLYHTVTDHANRVVVNNFLSPDVIGWNPVHAIDVVQECDMDNQLGAKLRDIAGLAFQLLPARPGYAFDLDVVRDVQIMAYSGLAGQHFMRRWEQDPLLQTGYQTLTDFWHQLEAVRTQTGRSPQLLLAGRVGPEIVARLRGLYRTRVFSEERGMKGLGFEAKGYVRSFVADVWRELGGAWILRSWAGMTDAAVVDTRVLQAALGITAEAEDRLWADVGEWQRVQHPLLRQITQELSESPFPLMTGGHSIVSSGLQVLLKLE
ncbi:MAG: hypothetical protein JWN30_107, partial [Bacilli bacterium]|nr:hypothetical protein [Bacilli bacterium]